MIKHTEYIEKYWDMLVGVKCAPEVPIPQYGCCGCSAGWALGKFPSRGRREFPLRSWLLRWWPGGRISPSECSRTPWEQQKARLKINLMHTRKLNAGGKRKSRRLHSSFFYLSSMMMLVRRWRRWVSLSCESREHFPKFFKYSSVSEWESCVHRGIFPTIDFASRSLSFFTPKES